MATIQDRQNPSRKMKVNPDGSIDTSTADTSSRIDDYTKTSTTYFGYADTGSAESDPVWQIKIIDESGNYPKFLWVDGNARWDNSWTNRTSLSYS